MKKLFSRNLFAMLAAVTLVTAALVTNCFSPIERNIQGEKEDDFVPYDPPAGMGYIRIKLSNNARFTYQPTVPGLSTLFYHVEIENNDTNVTQDIGTSATPVNHTTLTGTTILLAPGNYTVTVYASTGQNNATIIGVGTDNDVDVEPSTGGTVIINLQPSYKSTGPDLYGTGKGTFNWDITLPVNLPSTSPATLTVSDYTTSTAVTGLNALDLHTGSNLTGTIASMNAGFYRIVISMTTTGIGGVPPLFQNRTINHILHIAENMTTTFNTGALDDLNRYAYNVTYNHNDDPSTPGTTAAGPYAHGSTFTRLSPDPTNITNSAYSVRGWYRTKTSADDIDPTDPDVIADMWNFASDRIINDLTLYAGWAVGEELDLTVTYDLINAPTISPTTMTFNQSKYNNATLESITATVSVPSGFAIVGWHYDGLASWSNGTANSVTLTNNTAGIAYLAPGTHEFTVDLLYNSIVPYSVAFTLTVAP